MELSGETINSKQINLDGNSFIDCEITNSVLIYKGGPLPLLKDCRINDCQWSFAGEAANTLQFMAAMYSGMGVGGMDLIDQTISNIRNNAFDRAPNAEAANDVEEAPKSRKAKKAKAKAAEV